MSDVTHSKPLISACMIVRDEERNLVESVLSLAGLVDEVIVVDTGSTDGTVEAARSLGAKVFQSPWRDDFAFHRNESIAHASGRWVFVIDADEVVVETDSAETRHHLEHSSLPPVLVVREAVVFPGDRRMTMLVPRIFERASGICYRYPVHEQLCGIDCDAMLSNVTILHNGYATHEQLRRKEARNLTIARTMGDGVHALHCRARAALSLQEWQEVVVSARGLVEKEAPEMLRVEACVLGATAAHNSDSDADLSFFLDKGRELAPDCPDILFVELLSACRRYLLSLADGDSMAPGDFLRPWTFWHDRGQMEAMMDVLLGKRRLAS